MSISPRIKIIAHDLLQIALAWMLAWLARFNFDLPPQPFLDSSLNALPVVIVTQAAIAWYFGLYRGLWRFASLPDLSNILRAAGLGALLAAIVLFLVNRLDATPRSVLILYPVFLVFLLGGPRLLYRIWKDHALHLQTNADAQRVIVVGGGNGGEMLIRDMLREGNYIPVGLVDDNAQLQRSNIHGVPVLGQIAELSRIVQRREVDLLVIAIPSANSEQMRRIVESCEATGRPFRTLPQLDDLLSGRSGISTLREVSLEDLLGRDKVELEWQAIQSSISGETVLVSGGGGSIGSELCRQIATLGVARLVVLDNSEHNLYVIEKELRRSSPGLRVECLLADVRDGVAIERAFSTFTPSLVFHAAAYKHVPILQTQIREAVAVNVLGTLEMMNCADRYGCSSFVLISTDKAVRPSSVMGATKRLAELVCEARYPHSDTKFITVRFGNVLGSGGSVVPLFREQIAAGGPLTVTHADATRYFMTIPEACQLIMQAGAVGSGGEIFVLDMGEPVNITYLAEQLIRLSGHTPGLDIEIVYTGLRPGEKLSEELFRDDEHLDPTSHDKLLLAQHVHNDRNHIEQLLSDLRSSVDAFDEESITALLSQAVPEFDVVTDKNTAVGADNIVSFSRSVQ